MQSDSIWQTARAALNLCLEIGTQEFVICAGARNGPLVEILFQHPEIKLFNFFDERAAGFFALGRIRAFGKPVAVITTSGTAAAELFPAVIEAFHQGLPLIALTADRPRRFRGTGSPQTMNQEKLFGSYSDFIEIESPALNQLNSHPYRPLQINCCLEEPGPSLQMPSGLTLVGAESRASTAKRKFTEERDSAETPAIKQTRVLRDPLIVVGPLKPKHRERVADFLKNFPRGVYCESLSGLSHLSTCSDPTKAFSRCHSVLRLGGVPTHRIWRDLESSKHPVLSVVPVEEPWSGLARDSDMWVGWHSLQQIQVESPSREYEEALKSLSASPAPSTAGFDELPEARFLESLVPRLSETLVYVGNSLPVRHWDRVSQGSRFLDVCGNRGVNGIDGQVSTYLGWTADSGEESWCIVGDLTALYDLNSLWVTPQLRAGPRRILVINNGGGQIFQKFSSHPQFLNSHSLSFEHWAQQWGWDYRRWTGLRVPSESLPSRVIIEWRPE